MKRVFVFEYLTAVGPTEGNAGEMSALRAQGRQMRDAMVNDLLQVRGHAVSVATARGAAAPPAGAQPCRARRGEMMLPWLAREAALHDAVWLVAPECGGLLLQCRQAVPRARWLGCDSVAIALTTSKSATLAHLAAQGVCTPLAFAREGLRPGMCWVVKPDDGAGAQHTRVHGNLAAARQAQGAGSTLEPWVDGDAMSLSLLCRAGEAELLSLNRQHLHVDGDGLLHYRGVDIDCQPRHGAHGRAAAALAAQVARAIPGLRAYVGIDIVWHATHGPVLIEVNPRLTCAYVGLSARLGRNLAAEMLATHAHEARHAVA